MQYFLTSTGRAGCYVRKDKFDQRLASARSFAPRTRLPRKPLETDGSVARHNTCSRGNPALAAAAPALTVAGGIMRLTLPAAGAVAALALALAPGPAAAVPITQTFGLTASGFAPFIGPGPAPTDPVTGS